MKQPTIHIKDISGKDWEIKKISSINWSYGWIYSIMVDWYDNGRDCAPFFDYNNIGEFTNQFGNLKGTITFE